MQHARLWLATAALALLAGCAQPLKKQAFNREQAAAIKTVVIAQRPNQDGYLVSVLGHPGQSFGLIGALIEGADLKSKSDRLTAAIDPAETRLQDRFSAKLQEKLLAAGYATRLVVLPSIPSKDDELLAQVRAQATGDAVLAIGMFGEYVAAGPTSQYFPQVRISVRAVDTSSGTMLYQDAITYGFTLPQSDAVVLPSDPQYRFADIDALLADPAKAREGLLAGLELLAAQVATDLKRN